MIGSRHDNSTDPAELLASADRQSRPAVLNRVLASFRPRLRKMVGLRIHPKISARVDASDIVQDAFFEAAKRLEDYLEQRPMPFRIWLRRIAAQKLVDVHRRHLGAEARDARREISYYPHRALAVDSEALSEHLIASVSSPSEMAQRAERKAKLAQVLDGLEPIDREIIAMRHFEQLTNAETACELGIQESAASKRYVRALHRLAELLEGISEFAD